MSFYDIFFFIQEDTRIAFKPGLFLRIEKCIFLSASAESYLNECLAVYTVQHGPNHQKTIDIQDELAKIMIRTDRASVSKQRRVLTNFEPEFIFHCTAQQNIL